MAGSMIPSGAYLPSWFMSPIHISPEEAVQVHLNVCSRVSIGMHFGTFPLADDGQDQPAADLIAALDKNGISRAVFVVPAEGKALKFQ